MLKARNLHRSWYNYVHTYYPLMASEAEGGSLNSSHCELVKMVTKEAILRDKALRERNKRILSEAAVAEKVHFFQKKKTELR